MKNNWYTRPFFDILKFFHSGERGLGHEQAASRLREFGLNKLPEAKQDTLAVIFLRQFQSPLIYVLFIASIIVFVMGEIGDGIIILVVLIFNAIVGALQEGRAQNTLLALKRLAETKAIVVRDGKEFIVNDIEIVPGDIIILQEGEKVPADARVIQSNNLKIDEAALTGESMPVHKVSEVINEGNFTVPIADQKNTIFKGTHVVAGNGKAVVVATGSETAIGKISKELIGIDAEIPLKTNIRQLSHFIIIAVAIMIGILFVLGIASGRPVKEMFSTVVSLAISMIPEGLPIVITLVLARGVWRMSKRHALVKKIQAVGSIGQVQIIAVDKTGTLTKNEMMVRQVYIDGKIFGVEGLGYEPKGDIALLSSSAKMPEVVSPPDFPEMILAGRVASFCSNARVAEIEEAPESNLPNSMDGQARWQVSGDPTEAALLVFSQKVGFHRDDLLLQHPILEEVPFDYKTKYHAVVNAVEGGPFLSIVGAPEVILKLSDTIWRHEPGGELYGTGKAEPISIRQKQELESVFVKMSEQGLRVLAFAAKYPTTAHIAKEEISSVDRLTFIGFFGIRDTLRPEVEEAVQRASSAGARVVMITGDHKITAKAIAKEAGIFREGDEILTGQEIDELSDLQFLSKLPNISVFARVTPEHKLKIIEAYKRQGKIVAMTGDGVNDAPSLVAADIGVAMGKIGTEVAKESADMVLLDDNFSSIVSAIEEGRSIFKTIKKVLLYLFSTNIGEMLTIAGALVLGYPLPILAAQIIWLNLVTDGFLDVALAMEPKEKNLLDNTFEKPKKYLVDSLMLKRMLIMAISMMIGTLILFTRYASIDITKAWTISLTCLAIFQWWNAWNCRSTSESIFTTNPFSNKFLIGATFIVIFLQIFAVYNPLMQKLLHTTPLLLSEWLIIIPVAFSVVIVEETRKLIYRWSKA